MQLTSGESEQISSLVTFTCSTDTETQAPIAPDPQLQSPREQIDSK